MQLLYRKQLKYCTRIIKFINIGIKFAVNGRIVTFIRDLKAFLKFLS